MTEHPDVEFDQTDTCGACGETRRVAVTPAVNTRCWECYPDFENPWEFGVLLSSKGRVIEPGACERFLDETYQGPDGGDS